jgi:hypothetical protein
MPIWPFVPAMRFYETVLADKFAMVFMVEIALMPIRPCKSAPAMVICAVAWTRFISISKRFELPIERQPG